jgi:hypothetical protein
MEMLRDDTGIGHGISRRSFKSPLQIGGWERKVTPLRERKNKREKRKRKRGKEEERERGRHKFHLTDPPGTCLCFPYSGHGCIFENLV